ncbi:MAG: hypothetical protein J6Q89_01530, partial [Clostridia bacterium]|nr:hypothetical protein [Clostridia bacterium]
MPKTHSNIRFCRMDSCFGCIHYQKNMYLPFPKKIEKHQAFPDGVNVEFTEVLGKNKLRMRVWERGSGITMACGTGACA